MGAGVYSRLVEAHRLAAQLEAKIDVITQHAPAEIAAELEDVLPRVHAAKSRLLGAMLLAKDDLQTEAAP